MTISMRGSHKWLISHDFLIIQLVLVASGDTHTSEQVGLKLVKLSEQVALKLVKWIT